MLKKFIFNHDLANFVQKANSEGAYFKILLKMRESIFLHLEDLTEAHERVLNALEEYKPELISKVEKFFDEGLVSCNKKGLFVMALGEEYAVYEDGEEIIEELDTLFDLEKLYSARHWED